MQIEIISGFLGAGKTTFLNQYLKALAGEHTVVIENEFGSVGLDGSLIQSDTPVHELSSGCICCTLATDFREAIREIAESYHPDRILIEPSGVGHLSDIISACEKAKQDGVALTIAKRIVIVDIAAYEEYAEAFGSFYSDQIANADLLLLSNLEDAAPESKELGLQKIREQNPRAILYEDDWRLLDSEELMELLKLVSNESVETVSIISKEDSKRFSGMTIEHLRDMSADEPEHLMEELASGKYGQIVRAKGFIPAKEGGAFHFDLTLSRKTYRKLDASPCPDGRVILIGCELDKPALRSLFTNKSRQYKNKPHRA